MGNFKPTVRGLADAYGSINLFEMVSSDSGACSEANGRLVVGELGLHYTTRGEELMFSYLLNNPGRLRNSNVTPEKEGVQNLPES